jgi:toxin-antitoxin system PIN domain toxin
MILFDVNVLVYASNTDAADHERYRDWLDATFSATMAFGASELVLSSYVRIVTNRRILTRPLTLEQAFQVTNRIRQRPNCVLIQPGPRHWDLFVDLSKRSRATGNLVSDAYLAALAIESGSEWITTDRDFARFPGLRWRHPFE